MDIIFDFDGTITAKDTIGSLGDFGVLHQQRNNGTVSDHATSWKWIVSEYGKDFNHHCATYQPLEDQRITTEAEAAFLRSLSTLDAKSLERVASSRLFEGVTEQHLFEAGQEAVQSRKVPVRPGFADFASAMAERGARLSIISVNWSAAFIRGVVSQAAGLREALPDVISNEIMQDGRIVGPGHQEDAGAATVLTTSRDKLRALQERHRDTLERGGTNRTTVYFGDSPTDLECLVAASVGIVIADDRENSTLMRTLSRLGFDVCHVSELPWGQEGRGPLDPKSASSTILGERKLAWARNFHEVLESGFLDGWVAPATTATTAEAGATSRDATSRTVPADAK